MPEIVPNPDWPKTFAIIPGLMMLMTPFAAPCRISNMFKSPSTLLDYSKAGAAMLMAMNQVLAIVKLETCRSPAIIANRPVTCIGPIIEAANIAVLGLILCSANIGKR